MYKLWFGRLLEQKTAMCGLIVVAALLFVGAFAGAIAPNDPYAVNVGIKLSGPSADFPLGTDQLGRCVLSRLIFGTRASLFTAIAVTAMLLVIGTPLGILAGYVGGRADNLVMRLSDIASTFPSSLLALALVGALGPNPVNLALVFVLLWWAPFARITRSSVIKTREKEFVTAAIASGSGHADIILRHILPRAISPVIVLATLRVAAVITHVAGFSFIGLGSQPPAADWGVMLSDGRQYMTTRPLMIVWPGLAIMCSVFAFNLIGEGLSDALTQNGQRAGGGRSDE
jgi:peptide/nickel transport system permease protein